VQAAPLLFAEMVCRLLWLRNVFADGG